MNAKLGLPTAAEITARLQEKLQPSALEVIDESADHAGHAGAGELGWGTHFRVRIVSAQFAGKTRVACHRLVYDSTRDFIDRGLMPWPLRRAARPDTLGRAQTALDFQHHNDFPGFA